MGTKFPKYILDIAKKMDTPEFRRLYREQKLANKNLDHEVEEMSEEIQEIFKHLRTPKHGKK
jgi:hypothetical protein